MPLALAGCQRRRPEFVLARAINEEPRQPGQTTVQNAEYDGMYSTFLLVE